MCLGLPKIRVTILGVPITRIIVFGGLYWGPTIFRNYHMDSGDGAHRWILLKYALVIVSGGAIGTLNPKP